MSMTKKFQNNRLGPSVQEMNAIASLFAAGNYQEAIPLVELLTKRFPQHGFGWKALGSIFVQTGDFTAAQKPLQQAIRLNPGDAEAHSNLGNVYKGLEKWGEAESCYRKAIKLKPDYINAYSNLSVVLESQKNWKDAVEYCRQALKLDPNIADVHSKLGNALRSMGKLKEAKAAYIEAINLDSRLVEAYNNLGVVLRELDELPASADRLRQAIQYNPEYAEAYVNLGDTLAMLKLTDEAIVCYSKAAALRPEFELAHCGLGRMFTEKRMFVEAETCLLKALNQKPEYFEAMVAMSSLFVEMDRMSEAEALSRQALRLKPESTELQFQLSSILLEMGRWSEAEDVYCRLMKFNTDSVSILPQSTVTALIPAGRAGSLFFHSLFDGHPEIATLPGIYFKGWFDRECWKNLCPDWATKDWREQLVAKIINEYQPMFDARCEKNVPGKPMGAAGWLAKDMGFMEMGPDRSQPFVADQKAFAGELLSLLTPLATIGQKECFELIHRAFEIAIRGNMAAGGQENTHIFYHIHNPEPVEFVHFLQNYPQAKILYIVRHPVQGMESWMIGDLVGKTGAWLDHPEMEVRCKVDMNKRINGWNNQVNKITQLIEQMRSPFNYLTNSRGVRLEDVKRDSKRVMPQIAAWMGIADHPALYEASFCGSQYWGPASTLTGNITGFDTKAIDRPVGRLLGQRDIIIFETLFWPFSRLYGYSGWSEAEFRMNLAKTRPWLDEPLEFETRLYAELPDHSCKLEALPPYNRLHRRLRQYWAMLDRDGTYHGMVQPLALD